MHGCTECYRGEGRIAEPHEGASGESERGNPPTEPTHGTHPRNPPTEPTHARGFSISKLRRPFLFNNASIKMSAPAHTRGEH